MTVYLGNFSWETANRIAAALEEAGIVWWCKNPGTWTRVLFAEWGVRMFVDRTRLDEAREIARRLASAPPGEAPPGEGG